MPFEKFVPRGKEKPAQASVKKTGTVSLDLGFSRSVGLDKANHAILYFDPARKLLGIKPSDPKDEGAVRLSHRKRVTSVRAKPLFEAYGINLESTFRAPVSWDEGEGMVVVPLQAAQRRRGRPKRL
jgi:hypothetical protein